MKSLKEMQEANEERIRVITKTPIVARVFDPNCEHKDGGHHMIEYMVQDEEGNSYPHRLYQCNLCGVKVEGND